MRILTRVFRTSCALSTLAVLFLAEPAILQAEDYIYLTNNGTITITGYSGSDVVLAIPSAINDLPVTAIGDEAFKNCYGLASVSIPDTVLNIGNAAFQSTSSLTNVTIGNSVTNIGNSAFQNCSSLTAVAVPDSVTRIGASAFVLCYSLTNATIGNGVTSIGAGAFNSCVSLTSTVIPNSVTNIGGGAFYYCISLTNATIGASVITIGDEAFRQCGSLSSITLPDSVTSLGAGAFSDCTSLARVTIGSGITIIPYSAFYFSGLTNVTIPDTVTTIGTSVFYGCSRLTNVTIGKSVTSIGDNTHGGPGSGESTLTDCTNLIAITVDAVNTNYSSADGVLFDKDKTMLLQFPGGKGGHYSIPNTVTGIAGGYSFSLCPRLTSLTIPASLMWIGTAGGSGVFQLCTALTEITVEASNPSFSSRDGVLLDNGQTTLIQFPAGKAGSYSVPDGITRIGPWAFENSSSLTSVAFPDSVTELADSAFGFCTSLTTVTLPGRLQSIGGGCFYSCTRLTEVFCPASLTALGLHAFDDCPGLTGAYFEGNSPPVDIGGNWLFGGNGIVTVYIMPGTLGWGATFSTRPTAPWVRALPVILKNNPSFGIQTNRFGFTISWATNVSVVVEASTNLASPGWLPIATTDLTTGYSYFSDPEWTNHPARFYRVRWP